jgi:hypothetical protein
MNRDIFDDIKNLDNKIDKLTKTLNTLINKFDNFLIKYNCNICCACNRKKQDVTLQYCAYRQKDYNNSHQDKYCSNQIMVCMQCYNNGGIECKIGHILSR